MRSIKALILMVVASAFVGGCASTDTPDEKAPEKPTTAPGAPPLAGGPAKAPPAPAGG